MVHKMNLFAIDNGIAVYKTKAKTNKASNNLRDSDSMVEVRKPLESFIYLFEKQSDKDEKREKEGEERENISIHWFIP